LIKRGEQLMVTMYHTFFNQTNAMGYSRSLTRAPAGPSGCGFGGSIPNGMLAPACRRHPVLCAHGTRAGNPNTLYFGSTRLSPVGFRHHYDQGQPGRNDGRAISAIGFRPKTTTYEF
jgi:hypothetical protein